MPQAAVLHGHAGAATLVCSVPYVTAAGNPTPVATTLYMLLRGVVLPFAATHDDQPSSLGPATGQQLEQSGSLHASPQIPEAASQQLDTDCGQQHLSRTDMAAPTHRAGQSNGAARSELPACCPTGTAAAAKACCQAMACRGALQQDCPLDCTLPCAWPTQPAGT